MIRKNTKNYPQILQIFILKQILLRII